MENLTATAAYSFKQLDPDTVKTIFILGPSHHVRLSACALTQCSTYQTPLGDLTINREINQELLDTGETNGFQRSSSYFPFLQGSLN